MDTKMVEVKIEASENQGVITPNKYATLKPAWRKKSLDNGEHGSHYLPSAYTERHQDTSDGLKREHDEEVKRKNFLTLPRLGLKKIRAKKSPKDRKQLDYLRTTSSLIRRCKEAETSDKRNMHFQELREHLHSLEVFTPLKQDLIDESKLLGEKALAAIMDAPRGFYPSDINTDATALCKKLSSGNLDNSVYRGTKLTKSRAWSCIETYQYGSKANFAGEGNLHNGQWWPNQICTLRDGAHGQIEAGIHYLEPEAEAVSIVLSGNPKYKDVDNGDYIEYWSTEGLEGRSSKPTRGLLKSYKEKTPIRVLRSSGLPATNKYRPEKGYRYDGLYRITDYNLADKTTQQYKFEFKRLPIQTPIRFEGVAKRPTKHEIQAYNRERDLYGVGAARVKKY